MCQLAHDFTADNACGGAECKCDQTESDDFDRRPVQKRFRTGRCAYRGTQQDDNDIHQRVGGRFLQLADHAGFPEQVAEHQHTD